MYRVVAALLVIGFLFQSASLLRSLESASLVGILTGTETGSAHFHTWVLSASLLPGLCVGGLVLLLYFKRRAETFWVYLAVMFFACGDALQLLVTIPLAAQLVLPAEPIDQAVSLANAIPILSALTKIVVCWLLWIMVKRGLLTYRVKPKSESAKQEEADRRALKSHPGWRVQAPGHLIAKKVRGYSPYAPYPPYPSPSPEAEQSPEE